LPLALAACDAYICNMIQRIQSIYLLLVALIAVFLIFANPRYAGFTGEGKNNESELHYISTQIYKGSEVPTAVNKWINVLILLGIGAGSLFAIFLYKNRELQKKIAIYMCLLTAVFMLIMVMDFNSMRGQFPNSNSYPGLWSIFPIAMLIFLFLAWRSIRKDEDLLKSMDRIR